MAVNGRSGLRGGFAVSFASGLARHSQDQADLSPASPIGTGSGNGGINLALLVREASQRQSDPTEVCGVVRGRGGGVE